MADSSVGKQAEKKVKDWLDRPEEGYCFDRIPDQMTGFYGSTNISDFILYKKPYMYYIESKATYADRFDFSMLTDKQFNGMLEKSKLDGVYGFVIVLFATYKRAFILDIQDIAKCKEDGKKSLNITRIKEWAIPYREIRTVPNTRKLLLDYDKSDSIIVDDNDNN